MPAKSKKRAHLVEKQESSFSTVAKAQKKEPTVIAKRVEDCKQPNQLDSVITALSSIEGMTPFVTKMLGRMLPLSLGEPEHLRHRHQQRVVEMVSASLRKQVDILQGDVDKARAEVTAAERQLGLLKDEASKAEGLLAQRRESHQHLHAQSVLDRSTVDSRQKDLEAAKTAQHRAEQRSHELKETKEGAHQFLEQALKTWKADSLESRQGMDFGRELERLAPRLELDAAVVAAAKSVLAKEIGAARSAFDDIAMSELEGGLSVELQKLDVQISDATRATQESAAASRTAEEEQRQARDRLEGSLQGVAAAQGLVKTAREELTKAQQAETKLSSEVSRRAADVAAAQACYVRFQQGTVQTFNTLRGRTS